VKGFLVQPTMIIFVMIMNIMIPDHPLGLLDHIDIRPWLGNKYVISRPIPRSGSRKDK
jgi:hypothetical protein